VSGIAAWPLAGWFSPVTLKQEIEKSPGPVAWIPRQIVPRRAHALLARVRAGIAVLHPEDNFINFKATKLFE